MLFNLLEDSVQSSTGCTGQDLLLPILLVVIFAIMIIPGFFRSKREKKAYEEKMQQLVVGAKVKTIGLIYGEIVDIQGEYVTIKTGLEDKVGYVTVEKRAIYEVVPSQADFVDQSNDDVQPNDTEGVFEETKATEDTNEAENTAE